LRAHHSWLCLFAVGLLSSTLTGCGEVSAIGKSNSDDLAFGPTFVIKAQAVGLSAEEITSQIAAPLEKQLRVFETLPLIEVICSEGQAEILLHTKADCNLKQLEMLIRDRLASARDALPQLSDESGIQFQMQHTPVLIATVYSPDGKFDSHYLSNYVQKELRDQLTRIPGVGEVTIAGINAPAEAVLVQQHPGIAILVAPTIEAKPAEVAEALQKRLNELRAELPAGMLLTLPINATRLQPNETNFQLELQLPESADGQRKLEILRMLIAKLQDFRGLKNLVGFTQHPMDTKGLQACVVLSLAFDETQVAVQRAALHQLCDSLPGVLSHSKTFGKPDDSSQRAVISGPDVNTVEKLAKTVATQIQQSKNFRAVQLQSPSAMAPRLKIKIDTHKLAAYGLSINEVNTQLSEILNQPIKADPARGTLMPMSREGTHSSSGGLVQSRIKNSAGQEIMLSEVAAIDSVVTKTIVYRLNQQPAISLGVQAIGQQNSSVSHEQINAQFQAARNTMKLGEEYRLTWLEE
jgi:multidrug efflux pump subunit AcrB